MRKHLYECSALIDVQHRAYVWRLLQAKSNVSCWKYQKSLFARLIPLIILTVLTDASVRVCERWLDNCVCVCVCVGDEPLARGDSCSLSSSPLVSNVRWLCASVSWRLTFSSPCVLQWKEKWFRRGPSPDGWTYIWRRFVTAEAHREEEHQLRSLRTDWWQGCSQTFHLLPGWNKTASFFYCHPTLKPRLAPSSPQTVSRHWDSSTGSLYVFALQPRHVQRVNRWSRSFLLFELYMWLCGAACVQH